MQSKLQFLIFIFFFMQFITAQVHTNLNDFFLPGSQPLESGDLSTPAACSCHQQYDITVEPYFNWEGSMMGQSLRDQLFTATMSIARQDADSSADLCLRCHTPTGWLSGRSEPTNGSALIPEDYTGVNCLFCHRMIMPAQPGENPYPDDLGYTDPGYSGTGLSTYIADSTYMADNISTHIPEYVANGMFAVTSDDERRGPYTNPANPNHDFFYSPFHQTSELCGTCHDVSNPVYTNNGDGSYSLNGHNQQAPDFDPYAMFPVERTYSEWKMSAYNTPTGITGTAFGGNKAAVSNCQDCHMADVTGKGVNRGNAPTRTDLGLHDFTGGNTFMPEVLKTQFSGVVNAVALDSAINRATWMLQHAATMEVNVTGNELEVVVQNETGHKLPSGYPEGRRIWLNVQVFDDAESLIEEFGHYDTTTAVLTHDDTKVYEIKPGISHALATEQGITAGPSFHFVLNDTIYSDNRIPPRGFTNTAFEAIQSPPVDYTYNDGQYTDTTRYTLSASRHSVVATLYYQTTSKEYIDFLDSENISGDGQGALMKTLWEQHGRSAPVAMVQETWIDTPSDIFIKNLDKNYHPSNLKIFGPNPFNSQIKFEYYISQNGMVNISIYDISGSKVAELINTLHSKGNYSIHWIADDFASGTYFVRLQTGNNIDIKKVILIK